MPGVRARAYHIYICLAPGVRSRARESGTPLGTISCVVTTFCTWDLGSNSSSPVCPAALPLGETELP